jgi:hypothetical protein
MRYDADLLNGGVAVLLIALTFILVRETLRAWSREEPAAVKMAG